MSLLVTGFGPFSATADNASEHLARESGWPSDVLEVAYRPVEEFFAALAPNSLEAVLLLGVDVNATKMRIETVAHNKIGDKPDVRGEIWGPGPIDPRAPALLAATLWTPELLEPTDLREPGYDPGGYLCNFSFWHAVRACPRARVGIIHVPPFEAISKDVQLKELDAILQACALVSRAAA